MFDWRIVALVVLVALSAFFSAAETALFSLRQHQLQRLRSSTSRAARHVLRLLENPRRLLATVLVANTIVNVLIGVLVVEPFVRWLGPERGTVMAALVATIAVLVAGEIAPKSLAVARPLGIALRIAPWLALVQRLVAPVTNGLVRLTDWTSDWLAARLRPRDEALTADEIKTLVTIGWERGVVGAREKEFLHNVFHLDDREVVEIVTPRSRVFALDIETSLDEARVESARAGFARVPVYSDSSENIVGYVATLDLLWDRPEPDPRQLRELRRDLPFYPQSKRVGALLADMGRNGQEIAAVVDEHGGIAGVVSIEDAIEQVVGEIYDLHDLDRFRYTQEGDAMIVVAQMEITVFNRLLDTRLTDADAETIGGYVINRLGRIPRTGDRIEVDGLAFTVDQAAPNRVIALRVRRIAREVEA